ncbi:hypothetical protein RJT34_13239 [Clitoria ternatea]|uniref:Uncharacterized protein n=1 Tax=Clitoria ternatea TaxID=43366 RepID=A0AAN9JNK5_CLITE
MKEKRLLIHKIRYCICNLQFVIEIGKWTPLTLCSIRLGNSLRTALGSSSAATNQIAKNSPRLLCVPPLVSSLWDSSVSSSSSSSFPLTTSSSDLARMKGTTIASRIQVVKQNEAERAPTSIDHSVVFHVWFFLITDLWKVI